MKIINILGENRFEVQTKTREACRAIVIRDGQILLTYEVNMDQWFIPGLDDRMQHSLSTESSDGKIKIIKCTFYAGDISSCLEKLHRILQRSKMTEDIAGIIPVELSILTQYFPEGNIISHLNFGSEILL